MKILKRSLLFILVIVLIVVVYNYRKLNIIAGYSAKDISSSVFLAKRSFAFTEVHDTNFSPINLASDKIKHKRKIGNCNRIWIINKKGHL